MSATRWSEDMSLMILGILALLSLTAYAWFETHIDQIEREYQITAMIRESEWDARYAVRNPTRYGSAGYVVKSQKGW